MLNPMRIILFTAMLLSPGLLLANGVAVWDCAYRNGSTNTTTESMTLEFEESLIQYTSYEVFERRTTRIVLDAIRNERAYRELAQISQNSLDRLQGIGIERIFFCEIFDDTDSGEIRITVTLQNFNGRKELIKSVSMRRGLINDSRSRREKMTELVQSILRVSVTSTMTQTYLDYRFDLRSCSINDRTISCDFVITNNGEDRTINVHSNQSSTYKSVIYDDFNNSSTASRLQIANSNSRRNVQVMLISGRPTDSNIIFEGLSSSSTSVPRLDISAWDEESRQPFVITFRNINLIR